MAATAVVAAVAAATRIGTASPRHQRGVAAIFAALALVALLAAVGIAIDLSRFYFAQRDLQRMTNAAALDAARVAGGCLGIPADPQAAALIEVNQSVLRNGGQVDYVTRGSVLVGRMLRGTSGVRSFSPGEAEENRAVQVILRRPAPRRLIPLPGANDGNFTLTATAAAQSRPLVSLSVGSSVVSINNGLLGDLLKGLLGGNPNVNLISYQGLLAQSVPLGQLAEASGLPVDQFLSTPISLRQLISDTLTALSGVADPALTSALASMRDATNPSLMILPSSVVNVTSGYEDALGSASVSAGQLLMQAQQAVASSSINVPLSIALPLLGSINLNVRLISPGQQAVIPAGNPDSIASNAQGLVQLNTSLLPILGNAVNLKLFVQAAKATAELDNIHCARRGQPTHQIDVNAQTNLAYIGIGEFDDINKPNPTPKPTQLLNVLGVKVYGYAVVPVGQSRSQTLIFNGPPFPTATQTIGTPLGQALAAAIAQLPSHLSITTDPPVVGALVNLALQPVLALLTPALSAAVSSLTDPVLTPVLQLLGLSLGTADIAVEGVTNDQPYLFINSR